MTRCWCQPFFGGEKSPKGDTAQIFWRKSPFSLKIQFARLRPFLMSELPEVWLLATLLMLLEKSIAN
jgi:hypothetical protein